jgi:hypothetical protein
VETPLLRRATDSALKRYQRIARIRLFEQYIMVLSPPARRLLQDRTGPAALGLRRRRQSCVLPLL